MQVSSWILTLVSLSVLTAGCHSPQLYETKEMNCIKIAWPDTNCCGDSIAGIRPSDNSAVSSKKIHILRHGKMLDSFRIESRHIYTQPVDLPDEWPSMDSMDVVNSGRTLVPGYFIAGAHLKNNPAAPVMVCVMKSALNDKIALTVGMMNKHTDAHTMIYYFNSTEYTNEIKKFYKYLVYEWYPDLTALSLYECKSFDVLLRDKDVVEP